jgi:uncharacterized RDD family membrane protein YckC
VFAPERPALGPLEQLDHTVQRQVAAGRATEITRYRVVPLRVGPEAVPAIEIPYTLPDQSAGTVSTERLRLRVRGHLDNEANPALGPAPEPVAVISTAWTLIWVLVTAGAALLAALLTFIGLRIARSRLIAAGPVLPPLPANQLALLKLDALARDAVIGPDRRYAAVIDVLREYLGGRFGFDGLETTTLEMMRSLDGAELKEITDAEIRSQLEDADLVKFARITPSDGEAREKIHAVRRIVELTWEEPEVEEDAEERPRLEAADERERLRAGAIDVALFGTLGGFALVSLWVLGYPQWAWLGIVVFGLAMTLRDVLGRGSPGKALYALRVVSDDERQGPPGLGQRLRRNLLLLLAPVGLPVEALVLVYHPHHQRVGDRWAGTEVVRMPTVAPRAPRQGEGR